MSSRDTPDVKLKRVSKIIKLQPTCNFCSADPHTQKMSELQQSLELLSACMVGWVRVAKGKSSQHVHRLILTLQTTILFVAVLVYIYVFVYFLLDFMLSLRRRHYL